MEVEAPIACDLGPRAPAGNRCAGADGDASRPGPSAAPRSRPVSATRSLDPTRGGANRPVGELLAAVLGLAAQAPSRVGAVLADADERRRIRVDRDGRLAGVVGDRVDVAAGPGANGTRRSSGRARRCVPIARLPSSSSPWTQTSATLRAIVVVKAGLLARHPRQHPDVDLVVVVEQLVAPPVAIDDDERLPQIGSGAAMRVTSCSSAASDSTPGSSSSSDVRAASASEKWAT